MAENTVFYGNLSCAAAELDVGDLLPKIACAEFKTMAECLDFNREKTTNWPDLICSDIDLYGVNDGVEGSGRSGGDFVTSLARFQVLTGVGWVPSLPDDYWNI